MCLAIPGKVISIQTGSEPLTGIVSFGGAEKEVCLDLTPGVKVGEYVIVHVGFALNTVDEQEALDTLRMLREMGEEEVPP